MKFTYSVCPICEKKLQYALNSDIFDVWCSSGCYSIEVDGSYFQVTFFGGKLAEDTVFLNENSEEEYKIKSNFMLERIKYWKENYRYIAEILERG